MRTCLFQLIIHNASSTCLLVCHIRIFNASKLGLRPEAAHTDRVSHRSLKFHRIRGIYVRIHRPPRGWDTGEYACTVCMCIFLNTLILEITFPRWWQNDKTHIIRIDLCHTGFVILRTIRTGLFIYSNTIRVQLYNCIALGLICIRWYYFSEIQTNPQWRWYYY